MLIAMLILAFAIQFASHYLPWARLTKHNRLPRPAAYTIGIVGILIPLAVWLIHQEQAVILMITIAFCVTAGAGVIAGYTLDMILTWREEARETREREQHLQKLVDETLESSNVSAHE